MGRVTCIDVLDRQVSAYLPLARFSPTAATRQRIASIQRRRMARSPFLLEFPVCRISVTNKLSDSFRGQRINRGTTKHVAQLSLIDSHNLGPVFSACPIPEKSLGRS